MKSILLAPALVLSMAGVTQAATPGELFSRVEVKSGRAQIIQQAENVQTVRQGESISLEGKTYLEVPAGSEVRVVYPGQASLHLWGPATLDWQAASGPATDLRSPAIAWNIEQTTWCDLEVRRGFHQLNLPGDWHAQVDGGSMRLRGLATGPLEMRLNAGRPVRVFWSGDESQARPPMTIYPGSNIRLEQPTNVKVDRSGQAKAWQEPQWPYRQPADNAQQWMERNQRPERLQHAPAWPMPQQERQSANLEQTEVAVRMPALEIQSGQNPSATRTADQAQPRVHPLDPFNMDKEDSFPASQSEGESHGAQVQETEQGMETQAQVRIEPDFGQVAVVQTSPLDLTETAETPIDAVPVQESEVQNGEPTEQIETPAIAQPFVRSQWQGVSKDKLKDCGNLVVQENKGVEVRVFAGNVTKILVDRWEGRSTWVMTTQGDFHMAPGSVAVFDSEGKLRMSHGTIENKAVVSGRPIFSQIQ